MYHQATCLLSKHTFYYLNRTLATTFLDSQTVNSVPRWSLCSRQFSVGTPFLYYSVGEKRLWGEGAFKYDRNLIFRYGSRYSRPNSRVNKGRRVKKEKTTTTAAKEYRRTNIDVARYLFVSGSPWRCKRHSRGTLVTRAPRLMRRVFGAPEGYAAAGEVCSTERRNARGDDIFNVEIFPFLRFPSFISTTIVSVRTHLLL